MNGARPPECELNIAGCLDSADSPASPTFPVRQDTVLADALAQLLSHQRLTSLDSVRVASTTRMAATVHTLIHDYGWPVQSERKATGCKDGRVSEVAVYSLSPDDINAAMVRGGAVWCEVVRAQRLARRAKVHQAARHAERINTARKRRGADAQKGLFEGPSS